MKFFLVAGEPSGDALGAELMAGLKQLAPGVEFHGVGGPLMQAEGLDSLFPMQELSVMGLAEVLPKYPHLRRRMIETADAAIALQPDALITIDSPDFCLRVARRVKSGSAIRTVHYVAPTVWAWRAGRARKMARVIDQVLALFPFEPPYLEAEGARCDFVGHPVAAQPQASTAEVNELRRRLHLPETARFVLALPGSRKSEVERLAPVFGDALTRVVARHPGLHIVVPTLDAVAETLQAEASNWPDNLHILTPSGLPPDKAQSMKRAAFAGAEAALAASGTVSLELAAASVPMVIGYDLNWLSLKILRRMVLIDTVTLVNIVTGTRTVPEYLGADCTANNLSDALLEILDNEETRRAQIEAANDCMAQLGRGGAAPGLRAAQAVLDGLGAGAQQA